MSKVWFFTIVVALIVIAIPTYAYWHDIKDGVSHQWNKIQLRRQASRTGGSPKPSVPSTPTTPNEQIVILDKDTGEVLVPAPLATQSPSSPSSLPSTATATSEAGTTPWTPLN